MSRVPIHLVTCDEMWCETPPAAGDTADEALTEACAAGWLLSDDGDLCPDHREPTP